VGDLLEYAVRGIPVGCVFALMAVGLTLNYTTSGVFNLAFAAQAYASAATFYLTRKEAEWPLVPAAVLAILVVGPLIGVLLDRGLYRHQRTASPTAKLVTSLGLLVALPEIVKLIVGGDSKKNPPPLWPVRRTDDLYVFEGTPFVLDAGQLATIVATVAVVIGLSVLLRRTALGLQMRAAVESPRLLQLQGVDAERVSLVSWMLSSALAGLAGVLVAPLFAALTSLDFFTLLVASVCAAVIANLSSIPLAFAGGIGLGVLQAVLAGWLPTGSVISTGLRPSLPFVLLFGLLLFRRSVRTSREITDPLGGVSPPPPVQAALLRPRWLTNGTRAFAVAVSALGFALVFWVLDDFWVSVLTGGVVLSVILLSVVMSTGVGGVVSLCQASFAAIGAFTTAQLVDRFDLAVMPAMFVGAALAAAVGAVLSVPVVRLAGIYPALATLAFALAFQAVVVPLEAVSGGARTIAVPRPLIGPFDLSGDRAFIVLAAVVLALCSLAVIAIRQGTTGRFLDAIRGSATAAASIGIDPQRPRATAFVTGAAIAGLGGGLLASFYEQAVYDQGFNFFFGLVWLVLVITAGSRSVQAAITSGISFFLLPQLLTKLFEWPGNFLDSRENVPDWWRSVLEAVDPTWAQGVAFVLFGVGALTYAKHPEGIIEAQTTAAIRRIVAAVEGRRSKVGRARDAAESLPNEATT